MIWRFKECRGFWGYRGRLKGGDGGILGVLGRFGMCWGALRGDGVFWRRWGRLDGGFGDVLGAFYGVLGAFGCVRGILEYNHSC